MTGRVSPFLAWGDFHMPSHFPRSTIHEEKWGLNSFVRGNLLFGGELGWGAHMEYVLGCKWQIFVSFRVFGTKFQ